VNAFDRRFFCFDEFAAEAPMNNWQRQVVGTCVLVIALSIVYRSASAVTIDMVPIGNPGNPADTRYIDSDHPSGIGTVGYSFFIGRTEVTNAQYTEFLNAVAATDTHVLYTGQMASESRGGIVRSGSPGSYTYAIKAAALNGSYTYANKPVSFIHSGTAMRFANWLHNDQPTGAQDMSTTEDGAYTLNGANTSAALAAVTRNPGARWWLPNEDEWYKAAYHKNDGVTGNYWDYAIGTNIVPNNNLPSSDTGNSANYNRTTGSGLYPMTDVGAYALSDSPYGTFDQSGNVFEWTESLVDGFDGLFRVYRGGAYDSTSSSLRASFWNSFYPTSSGGGIGFRVASIPEPRSVTLCIAGVFVPLGRSGRK
jgi:formylglycine-generating enzyme required for sulfatase activity